MEEVENQTKNSLVVSYIFNSLMIISLIFIICASAIAFSPEEITDASLRFGVTLGFIAFIFIMASILISSLENLLDAMCKLEDGDYR